MIVQHTTYDYFSTSFSSPLELSPSQGPLVEVLGRRLLNREAFKDLPTTIE